MTAAEKTRLLAERVMGWGVKQANSGKWVALVPDGDYVAIVGLCEYSWTFKTWSPLTNLDHAGEVLEAMRAKGWNITIHIDKDKCVVLVIDEVQQKKYYAVAKLLPTAICHAALMADGVKEEEL